MELWYPPSDRPHLLEWWRPLLVASRAARAERVPWPIHIDDFVLTGRIDRPSPRPAIWVYRHDESGREIYVDATGQTYRFTPTPNAKGPGRFATCDIRFAIGRAGLCGVVEPIWYRPMTPIEDDHDEEEIVAPEPAPRRYGHLTVLDGGSPLAG